MSCRVRRESSDIVYRLRTPWKTHPLHLVHSHLIWSELGSLHVVYFYVSRPPRSSTYAYNSLSEHMLLSNNTKTLTAFIDKS